MQKIRKAFAGVALAGALVGGVILTAPGAANAAEVVPFKQEQKKSAVVLEATSNRDSRKLCEYEGPTGCTGWYPNVNTCANIAHHGTKAQIAACLAWSGYGSRG